MAEKVDLSVASGPTTTLWRVKGILLDRGLSSVGGPIVLNPAQSIIRVWLIGENGRSMVREWVGVATDAKIIALNKANLTSNTLEKRTMNEFIADGVFAGTVTGTPD